MIFKKYLQNKFTAISNEICTNTSLSTDARWCLWYLLTKPKDWEVRINDIRQVSGWGRDKVKSAINELIAAKYVVKRQERDGEGQFAINVYDVHEFPLTENPLPENPSTVDPVTANKSHTKDLKKPRTEKITNTEDNILEGSDLEAEFAEFWAAYPKRPGNPKHKAFVQYVNARKDLKVSKEEILQSVKGYAILCEGKDPQFIKWAMYWLKERRWQDDYTLDGGTNRPKPQMEAAEKWLDEIVAAYPGHVGDRAEAVRLIAVELSKGVQGKDLWDAARKYTLFCKGPPYEDRKIAPAMLENWLKFKWREMDGYEFCTVGPDRIRTVRPKKVAT